MWLAITVYKYCTEAILNQFDMKYFVDFFKNWVFGSNFYYRTDDSYINNLGEYKSVALLVGNYYNGDDNFKAGIEKDLQNASKVFKHISDHDCYVMLKRNFTKPSFKYNINRLATLKNKKMIAVYFSGHGRERKQEPMMKMQDNREICVYDVISKFDTKELANTKKIFVFDMCRSHKNTIFDWFSTILDYFSFSRKHLEMSNTLIMYACSGGQRSYMYKDNEGSIFTHTLAQVVLAPNSVPYKILYLAEAVCEKVQQKVEQEHKKLQHPKFEPINYYDTGDNEESKVHKVYSYSICRYSMYRSSYNVTIISVLKGGRHGFF